MIFKRRLRQRTRNRHPSYRGNARRLAAEPLEQRQLLAVDATMGLGPLAINGNTATAEVTLDLQATAGEMLSFFSVDLAPSSANLIAAGPDFSAFSFTPTTPLLDGWTQIGFLNDPGFESSVEFDDSLTSALTAGTYTLGTISVDLAAVGLSVSDAFTISIAGADTAIGVVEPGQAFRFEPVSFSPGSRERFPVTLGGADAVDEGAPYTLVIDREITANVDFLIDWGDGQQDTTSNADLPASGEVTHVFADGDRTSTIQVDLQNGTRATIGQISVRVDNVVPVASLDGPSSAAEGAPFVLSIGDVIDPGDDTVSRYIVDWGDGQLDSVEAGDLPANRELMHAYSDGDSNPTIMLDLVDEDGTHPNVATLGVNISNVAPDVLLTGAPNVDEGSTFVLTLGSVADPGDDIVTAYTINWGDGDQETIAAGDLPASREVNHVYSDGRSTVTITVDLADEDGTHAAAGMLDVTIDNVAPTLSLSGSDSVDEGSPFILTLGTIVDPGDDTVTEYEIAWGDGQQETIAMGDLPANGQVTHLFADGDQSPTITVDLIDEDGRHAAAGSLGVVVNNVPPTIPLSGAGEVDEGSVFTVTIGDSVDPGQDTITEYRIDWGDGQQDTIAAGDLPANGQIMHTFADGSDSAAIEVDVVDEDGTHDAAGLLSVSIRNVSPTVELDGDPMGNIGEPYAITIGPVTDPGNDTISNYIVDWGDGQVDMIPTAQLPVDGVVEHIYAQGGTTATVSVSLVDEDGRHDVAGSFQVFVNDVPPEITLSGEPTVDEGSVYQLMLGAISGPRRGQVASLDIDWGDGRQQTINVADIPADRTLEHLYVDGPASHDIVVGLFDTAAAFLNQAVQPVEVLSLAPVIDRFDNSASVPGETRPGDVVSAEAVFSDPGVLDTHTATIDWGDDGDAEPADVSEANGAGTADATHRYFQGGIYTIEIEIEDNAGTGITSQTTAFITGIRQVGGIVQIVGSEDNDIITVEAKGTNEIFVDMTVPSLGNFRHSFELADVVGLEIFVGAGNDRVMVSDRLDLETYMDGGPDNDHVQGGDGFNTILGGPGNDRILGGEKRDILIGGSGSDQIFGYEGDDLLLGSDTDELARGKTEPLEVWRSSATFDDRAAAIIELLHTTADGDGDTIFGGSGSNLYLLSEFDVFHESSAEVRYTLGDAKRFGWAELHRGSTDVYSVIVGPQMSRAKGVASPTTTQAPVGVSPLTDGPEAESSQPYSPLDVNRDGHITPIDVVNVINELNRNGAHELSSPSRFDSNGNGWIAPDDVLTIINVLNSAPLLAEGEAEVTFAPAPTATTAPADPSVDEVFSEQADGSQEAADAHFPRMQRDREPILSVHDDEWELTLDEIAFATCGNASPCALAE